MSAGLQGGGFSVDFAAITLKVDRIARRAVKKACCETRTIGCSRHNWRLRYKIHERPEPDHRRNLRL